MPGTWDEMERGAAGVAGAFLHNGWYLKADSARTWGQARFSYLSRILMAAPRDGHA